MAEDEKKEEKKEEKKPFFGSDSFIKAMRKRKASLLRELEAIDGKLPSK